MPTPNEVRGFTAAQLAVARTIVSVGRSLGASDRDILIALMAGFQESGLRNLNYGDRDSLGVFQQRAGWGTASQRLDPVQSARMFFTGGHQGQRGLLDFANRNGMSLTQAAQAVQVSAFPNAYAKWESRARGLLGELGGTQAIPKEDVGQLAGTPQVVDESLQPSDQTSSLLADMGEQLAANTPGLESPDAAGSPNAPGSESADRMPDLQGSLSFLPSRSTNADIPDGSAFEDIFPKEPGVIGGSRARVTQLARQLAGSGIPYVWGGTDPATGLDCSGFTQYVLRQVGVNLPRISYQQANFGSRTAIGSLQPGDLVAWDNSSRNNGADHIAIWLGGGLIAEAPRPGLSLRIRRLASNEGAYGVALDY